MMLVAFRVDSSRDIGLGHLLRCRTLARELRQKGAEVVFVCRDLPSHKSETISADGFEVCLLARPDDEQAPVSDAAETISALEGRSPNVVVVDSYALDRAWERSMRERCGSLLAIDDFGTRPHCCDLLLDQNFGTERGNRYLESVPEATQLLGPRFAMLDRSFVGLAPRVRTRVDRCVLFFGGADAAGVTSTAIAAFSVPELMAIHLDVVVGSANPHAAAIKEQCSRRGNASFLTMQPSLAALLARADLAVGAGGSTHWERLHSGLPSIVVSVAQNQVPGSEALDQAGFITYLGPHESVCANAMAEATVSLISSPDRLRAMSERGPVLVDGYGARRVAEVLSQTPGEDLRLRPAAPEDAALYYSWANEPEARQNSLNSGPISWADHQRWFTARLASDDSQLFVMETPFDLPVGQVRFDRRHDGAWRLSFSLDRVVRGRRLGTGLVGRGLEKVVALGGERVVAEVRRGNDASASILHRLGFEHSGHRDGFDTLSKNIDRGQEAHP